jgi:hypothetical protein
VLKPQESNRTNGRIKPFAAQQGKLVLIQDRAPSRFPNDSSVSGEILRSLDCGATLQN